MSSLGIFFNQMWFCHVQANITGSGFEHLLVGCVNEPSTATVRFVCGMDPLFFARLQERKLAPMNPGFTCLLPAYRLCKFYGQCFFKIILSNG